MLYRVLADLTVLSHAAFVVFVIVGGFLAAAWRWVAWIHIPVAVWGAWIEIANWVCPLTPLENWLRRKAGDAGYSGGFVEHYVISIVYPEGLTRTMQFGLAALVVLVNAVAYTRFVLRGRAMRAVR